MGLIAIVLVAAVTALLVYGRRLQGSADIEWPHLSPTLQWGTEPAAKESLAKIYEYAMGFCNSSIGWYQSRRFTKRTAGFLFRIGALLATATAGLIPLSEGLGLGRIPSVASTLLIAIAGLCISIDSIGGFTSGWVRYMTAQQKIERLRDAFLMDWNGLKIGGASADIVLGRLRTFLSAVGKVVDDESQEWATEFQNALKELERARRTEAETQLTGAIEISVKNPQAVTGWTLEIDGNQRGHTTGKSLAVTDVLSGTRKARVFGNDDKGRMLSDERILRVEGGATTSREFELG